MNTTYRSSYDDHGEHVKVIVLVRHGATEYTNIFPDLTQQGVCDAQRAANEIKDLLQSYRKYPLTILSSETARTRGTAEEIKKKFPDRRREDVHHLLRPAEQRDSLRAKEVYAMLAKGGYIDYENAPEFMDDQIFEPRDEVRERMYAFFAEQVDDLVCHPASSAVIAVSHYELLCHVVLDFFRIIATPETALRHCEPMRLEFRETRHAGLYAVHGHFRHFRTQGYFRPSDLSFFV